MHSMQVSHRALLRQLLHRQLLSQVRAVGAKGGEGQAGMWMGWGWKGAQEGTLWGSVFAAADSLLGPAEVCWDALTGKAGHGYCGGDRG